ncbi:MAG: hypothetical protein ACRERV_06175, partial [Methylococcales bacterium]
MGLKIAVSNISRFFQVYISEGPRTFGRAWATGKLLQKVHEWISETSFPKFKNRGIDHNKTRSILVQTDKAPNIFGQRLAQIGI